MLVEVLLGLIVRPFVDLGRIYIDIFIVVLCKLTLYFGNDSKPKYLDKTRSYKMTMTTVAIAS